MVRIILNILIIVNFCFAESLLDGLKKAVELRSPEPYIELFSDEKKEEEREWFIENIVEKGIKKIDLSEPHFQTSDNYKKGIVQILIGSEIKYELQVWEIVVVDNKISEKTIIKRLPELYEISIPSDRIEKVKEIVITSYDLEVRFKDAVVFWDNLPYGENTALLIYGDGDLLFSPSSKEERHQIHLYFKTPQILTPIKWLYVRISPRNLEKNLKIIEPLAVRPPPELLKRASEIFHEFSLLSYSVELPAFNKFLFTLPSTQEILIDSIEGKLGEFTYNYSGIMEENITFMERKRGKILCLYSPDEDKMRIKFSSTSLWDLLHEEIFLDFDPVNAFLSVRAKILFEAKEDGIDTLYLRLNNYLNVTNILEKGISVLFMRNEQGLISLFLSNRYRKGEKLELTINYSGKIYGEMELVDIQTTERKPSPRKVGRERKLKDELSSLLKTRKKEAFFLYSYNSLWHPLRTEWDFFTANINVRVPSGFTAISNGKLVKREGNTFFWEENVPIKYLSVAIGRLFSYAESENKIPIKIFGSGEKPLLDIGLQNVQAIMNFFSYIYGDYPFEKLYILRREWDALGGHSPASFVVLNYLRSGLVPKSGPGNLSSIFRDYFLIHEIAHQWWGNMVTGRSYRDICIPEGLAQFSTLLYIKDSYGEKAFFDTLKSMIEWINRKSKFGSIHLGTRIGHFKDDGDAFLAVIYDKTALSFYLLQKLIGNDVLMDSLRDVLRNYSSRDITIGELRRIIERRSGTALQKFFSAWFYNYTLPEVIVYWKNENAKGAQNLVIRVVQVGDTEFVFPLNLEWKEGREKIKKEVKIWERESIFRFPVKTKVKKLKVNSPKTVPGYFRVSKE